MDSETQTTLSDPTGPTTPILSAVSVKLPPLWTSNAKAWFEQAEAQFVLRNIFLEETRYFHVISALDAATAESFAITSSPPILPQFTPSSKTC